MNEKNILLTSIKDLFSAKMLKYSLLPFILTSLIAYILFFMVASAGLDHIATMDIESHQTTIENGVTHTDDFSATLENSAILKFLMSHAITSWLVSFMVYAIGGFFVLYASIFMAVLVMGFLTPYVLKELQKRHYNDVELVGFSNVVSGILSTIKWALIMLVLFVVFVPLYFIPIVNLVALNFPLYYFFHKMLNYDVGSTICSKEEFTQIKYFNASNLRIKSLILYLISMIPFVIFFATVFFVIYLGHTYFLETRKVRLEKVQE